MSEMMDLVSIEVTEVVTVADVPVEELSPDVVEVDVVQDQSEASEPRFGYDSGYHYDYDADGNYVGWDWNR